MDPGGDVDSILAEADRLGVELDKVLLTHGHLDHVGGVVELAGSLALPVYGPHRSDKFWLDSMAEQCRMFGFKAARRFEPDHWLEEGDRVQVGEVELQVLHCPGHTPGHVVFFAPSAGLALVGDVLFRGSVGRTDFPRGNFDDLVHSVRRKLFPLGDEIRFIPGHGPMSTFGYERKNNPYVGDDYVSE